MTADEIITSLVTQAGKSGNAANATARTALTNAIAQINREFENETLRVTWSKSVTSANNCIFDLPEDVRSVAEVGQWEAATERMIQRYTEIFPHDFEAMYQNASIEPTSQGIRHWILWDRKDNNQKRIRIVPPPTGSLLVGVRYYSELTLKNLDRLEDDAMALNGALGYLPGWFPKDASTHMQLFLQALSDYRMDRGAFGFPTEIQDTPEIQESNRMLNWLTGGSAP